MTLLRRATVGIFILRNKPARELSFGFSHEKSGTAYAIPPKKLLNYEARTTLPALMQDVHTFRRLGERPTIARTR